MDKIYKIEDFMDKTFVTLSPDTDVYQALDTFLKEGVTSAVVVDEHKKCVGILSEKDCLKLLAGGSYHLLPGGQVKDFMTTKVYCIPPYTDIFKVADIFLHNFFRRLIITDKDNTVLGQITRRDMLRIIKKLHQGGGKEKKIAPIM